MEYTGFCPICEKKVTFRADGDWLRDSLFCPKCKSLPRHRALFRVLKECFPLFRELTIHESSPTTSISEAMFRNTPGYSSSHFWPDVPTGSEKYGIRCEDLEHLTFPDDNFDLFITFDVMEHLLDPFQAVREIQRVLKPCGAYIFTVPIFRSPKSIIRACRTNGQIQHVLPQDYHGNPIGGGSLVTWEWGEDFTNHIASERIKLEDKMMGIVGEMKDVFIIRV